MCYVTKGMIVSAQSRLTGGSPYNGWFKWKQTLVGGCLLARGPHRSAVNVPGSCRSVRAGQVRTDPSNLKSILLHP